MRQHFAGEQFRSANAKFFPAQLRLRHVQPCGNARHCPAFAPGLFFVEHGGYAERRALAPCSLSALWRCPCPPSRGRFRNLDPVTAGGARGAAAPKAEELRDGPVPPHGSSRRSADSGCQDSHPLPGAGASPCSVLVLGLFFPPSLSSAPSCAWVSL